MADNVKDTKSTGPKSADSKRTSEPAAPDMQAAADQYLQDTRGNVFGDNTSSTGGANNAGQHGRDGGEINGTDNNPAPSKDAVSGEAADDNEKEE